MPRSRRAFHFANSASSAVFAAGGVLAQSATGPSKKPTEPFAMRIARSVNSRGGFLRFCRAAANTAGIPFSREITARSRSAAGAKSRLISPSIAGPAARRNPSGCVPTPGSHSGRSTRPRSAAPGRSGRSRRRSGSFDFREFLSRLSAASRRLNCTSSSIRRVPHARHVFEPVIVFVQARRGPLRGTEFKPRREIVVHDLVERRVGRASSWSDLNKQTNSHVHIPTNLIKSFDSTIILSSPASVNASEVFRFRFLEHRIERPSHQVATPDARFRVVRQPGDWCPFLRACA